MGNIFLAAKLHPDDVRAGLLRDADRGAVVGPVQNAAVAGLPRALRSGVAQGCQGGGVSVNISNGQNTR